MGTGGQDGGPSHHEWDGRDGGQRKPRKKTKQKTVAFIKYSCRFIWKVCKPTRLIDSPRNFARTRIRARKRARYSSWARTIKFLFADTMAAHDARSCAPRISYFEAWISLGPQRRSGADGHADDGMSARTVPGTPGFVTFSAMTCEGCTFVIVFFQPAIQPQILSYGISSLLVMSKMF